MTGLPCHVGLYHPDSGTAKSILEQKRRVFLEPTRGSKERGNEVFAALRLPADGAGLQAAPHEINFNIDLCACELVDEGPAGRALGILVRRAADAQTGKLVTVVTSVYGKAKLQTQLRPDDVLIDAQGLADQMNWTKPWVQRRAAFQQPIT